MFKLNLLLQLPCFASSPETDCKCILDEFGTAWYLDAVLCNILFFLLALFVASSQVKRFSNDIQEWCGKTAKTGRFIIPFQASSKTRHWTLCNDASRGFESRPHVGITVEVLDLRRVEGALAILHREEDIADAMAGKPPRKRHLGMLTRKRQETPISFSAGSPANHTADSKSIGRETEGLSAKGRERNGRKVREVLAVYKLRGAQLILPQARKPHPYRQDGVFCRQDTGEWAGQVTQCR